jgi:tRNA pseudouridine55 synthase
VDGVLLVDKPGGITSHDVVANIRRITGIRKIGHTGTLDPMATGLVLVCLGKATRIAEYLVGQDKTYIADIVLGVSTDTQDSTGETLSTGDASGVDEQAFKDACGAFVGAVKQVPPMVSALKRDGKPLYWYARKGQVLEREAREVTIKAIDVLSFVPGERAEARISVTCSSGTYIRTLCSDIGDRLGCGGMMSSLRRTRIGQFSVDSALELDCLRELANSGAIGESLVSLNDALTFVPTVLVGDGASARLCNGLTVLAEPGYIAESTVRAVDGAGNLLAIASAHCDGDGCWLAPRKVLADCVQDVPK